MTSSAGLQRLAMRLVPLTTAIVAIVLDLLPVHSLAPESAAPALLLTVAFFWTLHRPDLLTAFDLFMLGMVADLAAAAPPGVTALVLLAMRRLLVTPQLTPLAFSFLASWMCLAVVLVAAALLRWGLSGFVHGSLFPIWPLLGEAAVTFLIYPPIAAGLFLAARGLGEARHAPAG